MALSVLGACEAGALSRLDDAVALPDGGRGIDGGPASGTDAAPPDPEPSVDLGPAADGGPTPGDLGPSETVDSGPVDPCATVRCGTNARCTEGVCRCLPGFVDAGGGTCAPVEPGDPAGRTRDEVCTAWNESRVANAAGGGWSEPSATCDPGTLSNVAVEDTVRRINGYRWLAGLDPVTDDTAQRVGDQACALMMSREGRLSHTPGTDWACYSEAGATAAGRSNIAYGVSSSPQSIDLYMGDRGVSSLGHRRWILAPRLGKVGIGFAGRGQCLGVFDTSGSSTRPWTGYPNPGFAPLPTAAHSWSFHTGSALRDATVEVRSGGSVLPVTVYSPGGTYGRQEAIAWDPSGWTPTAGVTYEVTVSGFADGPVSYSVTLVDC